MVLSIGTGGDWWYPMVLPEERVPASDGAGEG